MMGRSTDNGGSFDKRYTKRNAPRSLTPTMLESGSYSRHSNFAQNPNTSSQPFQNYSPNDMRSFTNLHDKDRLSNVSTSPTELFPHTLNSQIEDEFPNFEERGNMLVKKFTNVIAYLQNEIAKKVGFLKLIQILDFRISL